MITIKLTFDNGLCVATQWRHDLYMAKHLFQENPTDPKAAAVINIERVDVGVLEWIQMVEECISNLLNQYRKKGCFRLASVEGLSVFVHQISLEVGRLIKKFQHITLQLEIDNGGVPVLKNLLEHLESLRSEVLDEAKSN